MSTDVFTELSGQAHTLVHGRTAAQWDVDFPLLSVMRRLTPVTWFNPALCPFKQALGDIDLTEADVREAEARLARFAPLLADAFEQVREAGGIIESELAPLQHFADAAVATLSLRARPARLLIKKDSHLPIAGSVKARGGIYEVLFHAERLALADGLITPDSDYRVLARPEGRALLGRHTIIVGSTGNLGMSIGIAAARLGFQTVVHMSADAREWKKARLRDSGVNVVEHAGDYGQAVERGRQQAEADPACHFIDDENSRTLFLGYAVAGARLKAQFEQRGIVVDRDHPLFVYLPCGVGGGPGGISFGLKLAFGDHVHCFFAEPTQSPCMLLGVYTGLHEQVSVRDFGLTNKTAADGLAVGTPSGFVGRSMQRMIDGFYTLDDDELFRALALMQQSEGLALEPSALAGALGFERTLGEAGAAYRSQMGFDDVTLANAVHLIWATGGGMVPAEEYQAYLAHGRRLLQG